MGCNVCKESLRYCPCCGEPLGKPEAPGVDVAIVIAEPGAPRAGASAKPAKPAMKPQPPRDMGSFTDRVSKRIRRTISGRE